MNGCSPTEWKHGAHPNCPDLVLLCMHAHMRTQVFAITDHDPLIEVAKALQDAALSDEYFAQRKLYPNVDFYSGLVYRAMGFPPQVGPGPCVCVCARACMCEI